MSLIGPLFTEVMNFEMNVYYIMLIICLFGLGIIDVILFVKICMHTVVKMTIASGSCYFSSHRSLRISTFSFDVGFVDTDPTRDSSSDGRHPCES